MPQVGNKKFPYTPSGIARANAIKKKLTGGKQDKMYRPNRNGPKRPAMFFPVGGPGGMRPVPRPKPPARPGMRPTTPGGRPFPPFGKRPGGGRVPVKYPNRPGGGRRPNPNKRYPRLLPGRGLEKYL